MPAVCSAPPACALLPPPPLQGRPAAGTSGRTAVASGRSVRPCGAPAALVIGLGRRLVVNLERRLLGWSREATFDPLCHPGYQDTVPEPLPAFLRVVARDDRPAASRRAGRMKQLTIREPAVAGMHGRDRRVVLLFRATCELMRNPVRHLVLLFVGDFIRLGVGSDPPEP